MSFLLIPKACTSCQGALLSVPCLKLMWLLPMHACMPAMAVCKSLRWCSNDPDLTRFC